MHIYLLGYRGSGKSTVARLLAEFLDLPSIDTDDWIEADCHQSIREIFESLGESGFREKEHQAIKRVAGLSQSTVVSLGGGAVLWDSNREMIVGSGLRVWLRATPEQLYERIRADSTSCDRRPQLTDKNGLEEVVKVVAERTPIYRAIANLIVDTDHRTPDQIAETIARWIESQKPATD